MSASNTRPLRILITGAASGIGLCFVKHYIKQSHAVIFAVDIRDIPIHHEASLDLGSLVKLRVDFSSQTSIHELVRLLQCHPQMKSNPMSIQSPNHEHLAKLDIIIHSAGIRGLVPAIERAKPHDVAAAETLDCMNSETLIKTYQINTVGTFTLLQALAVSSLLGPGETSVETIPRTKVIIMTSRMGSISYNTAGGAYAYRASKAALNSIVRSLSIDLPDVMFGLVHPGRVETGLTLRKEEGAIEADESVEDMLRLIEKLKLDDSGRFMDRFGQDIGW